MARDLMAELPGSSQKTNHIPEKSLNRPAHVLRARATRQIASFNR